MIQMTGSNLLRRCTQQNDFNMESSVDHPVEHLRWRMDSSNNSRGE